MSQNPKAHPCRSDACSMLRGDKYPQRRYTADLHASSVRLLK